MAKTKTIAELRRELAAKEGKLKTLTARGSKLAVQLSAVDREIAKLGGEVAPAKKSGTKPTMKRRKRAKNKQGLADVHGASSQNYLREECKKVVLRSSRHRCILRER